MLCSSMPSAEILGIYSELFHYYYLIAIFPYICGKFQSELSVCYSDCNFLSNYEAYSYLLENRMALHSCSHICVRNSDD